MKSKRPQRSSGKGSPIDDKKKKLLEEQDKLEAKLKKLEAFIGEAPRMQEQLQKERREQLSSLSSRGGRRVDAPHAIAGRGYVIAPDLPRKSRRTLKAERRQMQLKFFVLCLTFLFVMFCLYHAMR